MAVNKLTRRTLPVGGGPDALEGVAAQTAEPLEGIVRAEQKAAVRSALEASRLRAGGVPSDHRRDDPSNRVADVMRSRSDGSPEKVDPCAGCRQSGRMRATSFLPERRRPRIQALLVSLLLALLASACDGNR